MNRGRSGFTIVEALASVVLLGVGIAAAMGGLSSLSKAEADGQDRERMERLAAQKFDELVATGSTTSAESGDFVDRGFPDVTWQSQVSSTGVDNLNHISVTVQRSNDSKSPVAVFDSLQYVPPTTTTGTTP